MKKKFKIILLVFIIILIVGCKTSTEKNNVENEIKEEIVSGLKFKNIKLTVDNNLSILEIDVENTTNNDIKAEEIVIKTKDENGNLIATLTGYVGGMVKAKETKKIMNTSDINLEKVKQIEYEVRN